MNQVRNFSCFFFGLMFIYLNLMPILGPSLGAYIIGKNQTAFEREFNLRKSSLIKSILVFHLIFFTLVALIFNHLITWENYNMFWLLIFSGLIINSSMAIIFFYIGINKKIEKSFL